MSVCTDVHNQTCALAVMVVVFFVLHVQHFGCLLCAVIVNSVRIHMDIHNFVDQGCTPTLHTCPFRGNSILRFVMCC